jgi:methyltransferase
VSPPAAIPALAAYLVVLAVQRVVELLHSAHNERRLRARGAREHGGEHFVSIVGVHVLFPVLLALEVFVLGARPTAAWPLWLGLWLAAQALRYAAVWTLGDRWTVRVWVLPGVPRVRRGLYRWLPHPNYLAVVIELIAAPMFFGAWRTALLITLLNLLVLRRRIRVEEAALAS